MKKLLLFSCLLSILMCCKLYAPSFGPLFGSHLSEDDFESGIAHSQDHVFKQYEVVAVPASILSDQHMSVLFPGSNLNLDDEIFYIYGQVTHVDESGYNVFLGSNISITFKSTAILGKLWSRFE